MSPAPPSPLRILVVCTANICRSPMAAALLADACARRGVAVDVTSAGFLFADHRASDTTVKVVHAAGLDVSQHRSRVIDAAIVGDADLVLTMERRHARDIVLDLAPAAPVHTMKGFAARASALALDGDRSFGSIHAFVQQVTDAAPATALLGDGQSDEVADPHGRSARVHRKALDELRAATDAIAAALAVADGAP